MPQPTKQYTSLTRAQFNLLQRLRRGLYAPVSRYHTGTIRALERKQCVVTTIDLKRHEAFWAVTKFGNDVFCARRQRILPAPEIVEEDIDVYPMPHYYPNPSDVGSRAA